jgi:peptidoglycan hydrolase-like protein with peptidoglycan-binding domain
MRKLIGTTAIALGLCMTCPVLFAQSSDSIKQAQQALKDKGFDPGPIDGVDGQKTKAAVRDYQKSQNLTPDGRLGPQTLSGLGVTPGSPKTHMKAAGANLKNSYTTGGKDMGEGGKDLGKGIKDGHPIEGAKDFGKGVGDGAAKIGVGTGHAAKNVAKGVKNAVTRDHKTDTSK